MILTEGDRMVLTPTYYVFDLYKEHMDARGLDCFIESECIGNEKYQLERISASASEKDGRITLTMTNLDPDREETVTVSLRDEAVPDAKGRILTGRMDAYNDFGNAPLKTEEFSGFEIRNGELQVTLPPCSVAEIRL